MEKSAAGTAKQFKRLLILFSLCLFSSSLYLFGESVNELIEKCEVICEEQFCFTGKTSQFSLTINDIEPKYIDFYIDRVPDNVNFISSKKESSENGTLITMYFQFEKPGGYKIPPLVCAVKNVKHYIPFKYVEVYENPDTIQPELIVEYANTMFNRENSVIKVSAGSHIIYTVSIRYAAQINSYSFDLPKYSIFNELKRYPAAEGNPIKTEFSTAQEKVAMFDWQPLTEGEYKLPFVKITATSYSGSRYIMQFPEKVIRVTPAEQSDNTAVENEDIVFGYAFTEKTETAPETNLAKSELTLETVQELVQMRQAERKSFPFSKKAEERMSFEKEYGLSETPEEPSMPLFITALVIIVILAVLMIILLAKKKYFPAAADFIALCAVIIFSISLYVKLNEKTAVFNGTYLSSVPEENGTVSVFLEKGSYVRITKKAGKWIYIEKNETYGWITEDNVVYIHR